MLVLSNICWNLEKKNREILGENFAEIFEILKFLWNLGKLWLKCL